MQRYYVNRTGHAEGPFDEAMVIETIKAGHVAPNAQLCVEGGDAWVPIVSHPPFAAAMPSTTAAATGTATATAPLPKRKMAIGVGGVLLLSTCCIGGILFLKRGGFEKSATSIANDIVRYGLRGEPVEGEWINDPPAGGGANVYATNVAENARVLAPLGEDPETAAIGVTYKLCGAGNAVRIMAVLVDGERKIADVRPYAGDACEAERRDSRGTVIESAHVAEDPRVLGLGEEGVALWELLKAAPACELPLLAAADLTEAGVPGTAAALLMRGLDVEAAREACALAQRDTAIEPFVHLGNVDVILLGQGRVGGISARPSQSALLSGEYTLTEIHAGLME